MSGNYRWWTEPATWAGAQLLRALAATWRVDSRWRRETDEVLRTRTPAIFALWHSRLLPLVTTHRSPGVVVLVSQHQDGQVITRVIERFGFRTARGSSTRGGEQAIRDMLRSAGAGVSLAITPDGPRGPAEIVKPGLVFLASHSGLPVQTVGAAATSAWRMRSWDGFLVPRPFSRVAVAHGELIRVPPDLELSAAESWRDRIQQSLHEACARAQERLGVPA